MLVISKEQKAVLDRAVRRSFERRSLDHLSMFSPPLASALGEDALARAITQNIDRAALYGFDWEGPVTLWLELTLLFGSRFDEDPSYPWISAILVDRKAGQMERSERLWSEVMRYRAEVAGPEDANTLAAIRRLSQVAVKSPAFPETGYEALIDDMIEEIWPERATTLDPSERLAMIDAAKADAGGRGLGSAREIALVTALMFAFGRGCLVDPLYPWIDGTLSDEALGPPSDRAKRLERRANAWMSRVLRNV
jgi:hypothetical protein